MTTQPHPLAGPHHWLPSPYGHGEWACTYCKATNREIAAIGDLNHCSERAAQQEDREDG